MPATQYFTGNAMRIIAAALVALASASLLFPSSAQAGTPSYVQGAYSGPFEVEFFDKLEEEGARPYVALFTVTDPAGRQFSSQIRSKPMPDDGRQRVAAKFPDDFKVDRATVKGGKYRIEAKVGGRLALFPVTFYWGQDRP